MAIQSATALNAYLTADPSGSYGAGSSATATTDESSAARAGDGVTPGQVEDEVTPAPAEDTPEPAPAEDTPPGIGTALPATYARNARPVMARAQTPSISLLA